MPVIIIGAIAVAVLVIMAIVKAVAAHATLVMLALGIGLPAMALLVFAFIRGLNHHTMITVTALEKPKRKELPPPAQAQVVLNPPKRRADPFSTSEPGAWHELLEEADREELARRGPREVRRAVPLCLGPDCRNELDDDPWVLEVTRADGNIETPAFCSGECAEAWRQNDSAYAGRSGSR
jgi:hypothetical protein